MVHLHSSVAISKGLKKTDVHLNDPTGQKKIADVTAKGDSTELDTV